MRDAERRASGSKKPGNQRRPAGFLRLRRAHLAVGAMAFTAALATIPALPASADVVHEEATTLRLQSIIVGATTASSAVDRSSFSASQYTLVSPPVPMSTTISSGFGYRIPPCAGCSSYHEGIDLLAGAGNPVEAIADGVVSEVGNPSGSLGVYVVIDHVIDGQRVSSVYAHMQYGSMSLRVGDVVTPGTVVGNTGMSTGPHLFFGIRLGGTIAVDSHAWLVAHVNSAEIAAG